VYVRQSSDKTGEGAAVERQREDALSLARVRGWEVVRVEVDNDVSAAGKRVRPGFEAVMSAVESGEVGAVIAWDMTRLSRNRRDTVRVIETGERARIVLAFCRASDIDLSTPAGRVMADILAAMARQEIDVKSDRQRRANLQAAQAGRRVGGRRPFGYEPDGMTVREVEADAVRQGYADLLAGVSLGGIAKSWDAAGLFTASKALGGRRTEAGAPSRWTASSVRVVLINPRYAGLRGYGSVPERGRRVTEAVGKAQWPALVSEETWRAAVGMLTNPARRTAGPGRGRALLTGIALCGVCEATVHAGGANTGQGPIYRCSGSYGHVSRSAPPVEAWVREVVVARLSRPDAAELLHDTDRPDVEGLRAESAALRTRLEQLAEAFAEGDLTSAQLRTGTERLRAKLANAEAAMADSGKADLLGPLVSSPDVAAAWDALSTDRQRAVIDALLVVRLLPPGRGTRTFRPETVVVEPKIGADPAGVQPV